LNCIIGVEVGIGVAVEIGKQKASAIPIPIPTPIGFAATVLTIFGQETIADFWLGLMRACLFSTRVAERKAPPGHALTYFFGGAFGNRNAICPTNFQDAPPDGVTALP